MKHYIKIMLATYFMMMAQEHVFCGTRVTLVEACILLCMFGLVDRQHAKAEGENT